MYTKKQISKFIKDSVDWLIDEDMGCTTLKLDDRLAICVGWLPGYGKEKRDDVIQSVSEPDFAINAGIKVYTSDDMRTDYEFINMPYYDNGEVLQTDVSIEPDEDYDKLAEYFLKEYDGMKDLEIEEDGRIIEKKDESLKENTDNDYYSKSAYKDLINDYFEYSVEFRFLNIVARILSRIDDFSNEEDIDNAIDDEMTYTASKWEVYEFYVEDPEKDYHDEAFMSFRYDIFTLADKIVKQSEEKED